MKGLYLSLLLAAVAACQGAERGEEGITKRAADTIVTERQVQDTAVVVRDTTVRAETTVKVDTMRKSANVRPADTLKKSP